MTQLCVHTSNLSVSTAASYIDAYYHSRSLRCRLSRSLPLNPPPDSLSVIHTSPRRLYASPSPRLSVSPRRFIVLSFYRSIVLSFHLQVLVRLTSMGVIRATLREGEASKAILSENLQAMQVRTTSTNRTTCITCIQLTRDSQHDNQHRSTHTTLDSRHWELSLGWSQQ